MYRSAKRRVCAVLGETANGDRLSRGVGIFLLVLIVLNVLAVILETVEPIAVRMHRFFEIFEVVSVAIFSVEYVARLWCCTADERRAHGV